MVNSGLMANPGLVLNPELVANPAIFYVHFPVVLWFYYLFTVTMTTYGLQSMITWQFTTKGCTVAITANNFKIVLPFVTMVTYF